MAIEPRILSWFFVSVVLALMPLILNLILVKVGRLQVGWAELLKDGELFFFATSLAASALGTLLFKKPGNPGGALLLSYLLLIVLTISSGLFALASFLKLTKSDAVDKTVFSLGSILCALASVILSFLSLLQVD